MLSMQAIKYKWMPHDGTPEPHLFLSGDGGISRTRLLNNEISLSLGERHCIGHFVNGRHVKCPGNRVVNDANCNECKLRDDFFMCMKCDGSECINKKQRSGCEENIYFIYLAAFGSILKVGISYRFRLMERLIEQGADFGAKIAAVKDGKEVRTIEQKIKHDLNIVDRLTGEQKQGLLFGNPNTCIENIFSSINTLKNNGGIEMVQPEVYDLRGYYRLENVVLEPEKLKIKNGTKIEGSVVAAKGNIVIVKNGGSFLSFNSHDLIGREIKLN